MKTPTWRSCSATLALTLAVLALPGLAQQTSPEPAVRTAPERRDVGLRVCNRSAKDAQVAAGYFANEHDESGQNLYRSDGWFKVNAGDCLLVYTNALRYRYYYVYAESTDGRSTWAPDEGIFLCVAREAFKIKETRCPQGYNRRLFRVLDTGENVFFTYNLTP